MADNVQIDPGATPSELINADDCGASGKVQGVKLAYSADGVATYVTADANGIKAQLGAALPAGTNAIGKLAANSGVDIGDVDVTSVVPGTGATALGKAEDAAHVSGDTGVMALAVRTDAASGQPTARAGADGDYIPLATDANGALWTRAAINGATRVSKRVALSAAQTGAAVWTPAAGKKFVLKKLVVSCATAGKVQFFDGADSGNTVIGPQVALAANGGWSENWDADMPYVSAAANNVLKYTTDGTFVGSVYVEGFEV